MRKQAIFPSVLFIVAGFLITGCASILIKETKSFKNTTLFDRPCIKVERDKFSEKFEKIDTDKKEKMDNECFAPSVEIMVQKFWSIQEIDEKKNISGDTIEEVRLKGFTIYWDEKIGKRVPNTRALFGDEALAALGIGVGGDARFAQDAKAISDFKGRHYGEMYEQEDVLHVIDRICINTRNTLVRGDTYTFIIVWRDGRVLRRVIKGGSINHPSSEHAIFLCPGDAIAGGMGKGAEIGLKSVIP